MATHVNIAVNLLRNAAFFFRDLGLQNPDLKDQMYVNATTYESIADMLENDPHGEISLQSDDFHPPHGSV